MAKKRYSKQLAYRRSFMAVKNKSVT